MRGCRSRKQSPMDRFYIKVVREKEEDMALASLCALAPVRVVGRGVISCFVLNELEILRTNATANYPATVQYISLDERGRRTRLITI